MAFAVFVALLALSAIAATPASAKAKTCADQVVSDWYNHKDRKVHGHYPLHCYREALDRLDPSVDTYTNARDAISAALAAEALRGNGGGPGARPTGPLRPGEKWIDRRNTYDFGLFDQQQPGTDTVVPTNTRSPSSVPVPLIVLAGLAVVLLLAGGGSYVARRVKASRAAPVTVPPGPDS